MGDTEPVSNTRPHLLSSFPPFLVLSSSFFPFFIFTMKLCIALHRGPTPDHSDAPFALVKAAQRLHCIERLRLYPSHPHSSRTLFFNPRNITIYIHPRYRYVYVPASPDDLGGGHPSLATHQGAERACNNVAPGGQYNHYPPPPELS